MPELLKRLRFLVKSWGLKLSIVDWLSLDNILSFPQLEKFKREELLSQFLSLVNTFQDNSEEVEDYLLVTHSQVISQFLSKISPKSKDLFAEIPPASIWLLRIDAKNCQVLKVERVEER